MAHDNDKPTMPLARSTEISQEDMATALQRIADQLNALSRQRIVTALTGNKPSANVGDDESDKGA